MNDARTEASFPDPGLDVDRLPVLVIGHRHALYCDGDGVQQLDHRRAARIFAAHPYLTLNAAAGAMRLRQPAPPALDLLELFAFVRPAVPLVPTINQIAAAVRVPPPADDTAIPGTLRRVTGELLAELGRTSGEARRAATQMARFLASASWPWAPLALAALDGREAAAAPSLQKIEPFSRLPEWDEGPPLEPPEDTSIAPERITARLRQLVGVGAEDRPAQVEYAAASGWAFAPRENAEGPNVAFIEAGTGIGKTLGYIAPASLWAEESGGTAWLSTYTKNLQRQLDQELARLYPDPRQKARDAVIRKGRENYLCLLNLEEALGRAVAGGQDPRDRIFLGLILRWVAATRDGDMIGGDFPSWLGSAISWGRIAGLTDRRGECTYSACGHYRRCFIERSKRAARRARLVVANHALVMAEAVNRAGDPTGPTRFVFDEGHHLFDAADSAFAVRLSGQEAIELRRWLLGARQRKGGRARGLKARIGDLVGSNTGNEDQLGALLEAAGWLPDDGWLKRIAQARPDGVVEDFLAGIHAHVHARAGERSARHSLEAAPLELDGQLVDAAHQLADSLTALLKPMAALAAGLKGQLDEQADKLESGQRTRIEAAARGLARRAQMISGGWIPLLEGLVGPGPGEDAPATFVDWFSVERYDGRELDIGVSRHWVDPMEPFAEVMSATAHGLMVTSATLRDQSVSDGAADWQSADLRLGAQHFVIPPKRASFPSPFDYGTQTRILVVTDVDKRDRDQVAAAYRELFLASGGGALGIFTAIDRLRAVHARMAEALSAQNLPLYAQHVDPMDTGTLVDMFRAERDASLLGTDAVRDGVDVPGESLRLIVFDRVPWPRPTLLHRARRTRFGGREYDEMVTRLKLKQAYGRLVRRATDHGVFIILDSATPSRLLTALPDAVPKERVGLAEAIRLTREFLGAGPS